MSHGPNPVTGLSYNCNGSNTHFSDVPGISATLYGPNLPVTRDAMAKFLSNAFNLRLYEAVGRGGAHRQGLVPGGEKARLRSNAFNPQPCGPQTPSNGRMFPGGPGPVS